MTTVRPFSFLAYLTVVVPALLLAAGPTAPAQAQLLPPVPEETAAAEVAVDTLERGSPRSSVTALLKTMAADEYEKAGRYFAGIPDPAPLARADAEGSDTSPASESADAAAKSRQGAAIARKFRMALDESGVLKPFARLSASPDGDLDDGLDPSLEEIGSLRTADGPRPILLQRMSDGNLAQAQWRVAPTTMDILAAWRPPSDVVEAQASRAGQVAGAPMRDWLVLIGLAAALFAGLRMVAALILAALRRIIPHHDRNATFRIVHAALPPLALYGATVAFFMLAGRLEASIVARQMLLRGAGIAAWLAIGWFLFRLIDAVARLASERMNRAERRQAASIITLLRRVAKIVLLIVIVIAVLDTFQVDVTTGIAALGIGGLALALGAQKTIENLVGSVTIIGDHPVQVGDAAQIGDTFGTVEDIGMRSTRVRTTNRTVVTIPNGYLAGQKIENFSARDRFLFKHSIGITQDTSVSELRSVLESFRSIIAAHEHVIEDEARVSFVGLGESALKIEVFCYLGTRSFAQSLQFQEELLLTFMRKLEDMNVRLAFPTRTLQIESWPAADRDRSERKTTTQEPIT